MLLGQRRASGAAATSSAAPDPAADPAADPAVEAAAALPFTLGLPGSYEEFAALVAGRPAEELGAAVGRIRACNAPALLAGGRRRLQARSPRVCL